MIKSDAGSFSFVERHQTSERYLCGLFFSPAAAISLIAFMGVAHPVWSANWSGSSGVSVEAAYVQTDIGADSGKDSGSSLSIEPFYAFSRASRKQDLNGRFGIRHRRFSGDGGQSTSPSLTLDSRTTLVERGLWLNAKAGASQRRLSASGFTDDTPTDEDQIASSYQFQLGPEFRYKPVNNVLLRSKAGIARTEFSGNRVDDDTGDSTSAGVEGEVAWTIGPGGLLFTINSDYQQTRFDSGQDASVGSVSVGSVFPVTPRLHAYGRVGYDWLLLDAKETGSTTENISQEQYVVGVNWRPGPRIEMNAAFAERAFGRQPVVSVALTGRRSKLEFRWRRDLQIRQFIDTDLQLLPSDENSQTMVAGINNESSSLEPCTSQGSPIECQLAVFVSDGQVIQEEIAAIYTLSGRASTLQFSLGRTELENLDGLNGRKRNEAQMSISRKLAKNLSLTLRTTLSENTVPGNQEKSDSQSVSASIVWLSK